MDRRLWIVYGFPRLWIPSPSSGSANCDDAVNVAEQHALVANEPSCRSLPTADKDPPPQSERPFSRSTCGKSRMRECFTYGSVWGATGNGRPYRDPRRTPTSPIFASSPGPTGLLFEWLSRAKPLCDTLRFLRLNQWKHGRFVSPRDERWHEHFVRSGPVLVGKTTGSWRRSPCSASSPRRMSNIARR